MSWLDIAGLRARLNGPPRLYLHRVDEIDEPAAGRGRRFWVVSRALCRFFKVDALADVSPARQVDALQLQIERLSPFAETGAHFDFTGGAISLWLWDAQAVRDAAAAIGVDPRRVTIVPETALQPPGDGVRLVECLDGVEGQCWEAGRLSASRWWPSPPDSRNWVMLQRGASIGPAQISPAPPPPIAPPWLASPWTRAPNQGLASLGNLDMRTIGAAAAIILLIGYGYFGAQWLRLGFDISGVEGRIAAASAAAAPVSRARAAALDDEAAIQQLERLDRYPSQLAVMAQITDILPKNDTHLTEWSYVRGQLEFTVAANHPLDATYFVRSLDHVLRFKAVSAERAGSDNSLRIRLTVAPR